VARAKRTDRAEARRRYRAQLAAEGTGEDLDPAEEADPAAEARGPDRTPPRRAASTPPPTPRPGIGNAFRAAFRPANLREDLAGLPRLVRHRSVWLPALISIGTTVVLLVTGGRDVISALIYQYFIVTPPIGAIFLSGFLAPRASYLTGALAGLVGAVCLAILVAASSNGALGGFGTPVSSPLPSTVASPVASTPASPAASAPASPAASAAASGSPAATAAGSPQPTPTPSATGRAPTPEELSDTVAISFVISPLTGAFFGAAAAWYRRFLNLANPNRGARRQPAKGKPRRR
jgi:hypothetical protein